MLNVIGLIVVLALAVYIAFRPVSPGDGVDPKTGEQDPRTRWFQ